MATFLFQQFPCLAFTSQWPIQQSAMPRHIQMGPVLRGYADTSWIMKQHREKPWQTEKSEGENDAELAVVHRDDLGAPLTSYQRLPNQLVLMLFKTVQTF